MTNPDTASSYSVGVGITSACNLRCRHCYSGSGQDPLFMDTDLLFEMLARMPIHAVNLGTGESALHPDFERVVDTIVETGIELAVTSNGYSISRMSDDQLRGLHDVDLSLDFPGEGEHDACGARGPTTTFWKA